MLNKIKFFDFKFLLMTQKPKKLSQATYTKVAFLPLWGFRRKNRNKSDTFLTESQVHFSMEKNSKAG